jgi:hypothetical protein
MPTSSPFLVVAKAAHLGREARGSVERQRAERARTLKIVQGNDSRESTRQMLPTFQKRLRPAAAIFLRMIVAFSTSGMNYTR